MSRAFIQRMREAAQLRRATIQDTRRQIARIYEQALEELADKLTAQSKLTQRWADTYIQEMRGRVHALWQQVGTLTEAGMHTAAAQAVGAQVDMLADAAELMGLDMRSRFAATFARTPDEAVASVVQGGLYSGKKATLSKRIWRNGAIQAGQIEHAITQALAQQKGGAQLARELMGFVREDAEGGSNVYDLFDPDKASYNARRLATTAINHAYWSATLMTAEENPYAEYLHWQLSAVGNHCPYCIDYASHDEGLGIGNWPLDKAPLPHPWCTCLWYIDTSKSLAEIGRELHRWEQGEGNPTTVNRYLDKRGNMTVMAPNAPDNQVMAAVSGAVDRIAKDIPEAGTAISRLVFAQVDTIAELHFAGGQQTLYLDNRIWSTLDSIKALLAGDHDRTRNVNSPEFIIAHEMGHALHNLLAQKRARLGNYVTGQAASRMMAEHGAIAQEVYLAAFGDEPLEEIYRQIQRELGTRAVETPSEFIAQSFGMVYYGSSMHPIADSVVQYFVRQFAGLR